MTTFGCTWVWDSGNQLWVLQTCNCPSGQACPVPGNLPLKGEKDPDASLAPLADNHTLDTSGCFKVGQDEFTTWAAGHGQTVPSMPTSMEEITMDCESSSNLVNCTD